MESPRVCVIDSSPAVRETLAIILSDGYAVDCLSPEEFRRDPSSARTCDALIIGEDCRAWGHGLPLPCQHAGPLVTPGNAPPPFASARWATLSPAFDPQELRATLRDAAGQRHTAAPHVECAVIHRLPGCSKGSRPARTARRPHHLPVLLCGDVGTGKTRLARAIHALGQRWPLRAALGIDLHPRRAGPNRRPRGRQPDPFRVRSRRDEPREPTGAARAPRLRRGAIRRGVARRAAHLRHGGNLRRSGTAPWAGQRPLLPAQCVADHAAAPARAHRRHPRLGQST